MNVDALRMGGGVAFGCRGFGPIWNSWPLAEDTTAAIKAKRINVESRIGQPPVYLFPLRIHPDTHRDSCRSVGEFWPRRVNTAFAARENSSTAPLFEVPCMASKT